MAAATCVWPGVPPSLGKAQVAAVAAAAAAGVAMDQRHVPPPPGGLNGVASLVRLLQLPGTHPVLLVKVSRGAAPAGHTEQHAAG